MGTKEGTLGIWRTERLNPYVDIKLEGGISKKN